MLLERIAAYSIPNILVAGDFNSNERSNVYRVMTGLPPDYMASTERGYTRKNETEVRAIAKPMPIALKSAYVNYHEGEHPNLTINHFCFTGVLDFIFHNEGMEPVKLLKTPAPAEVEGYTPNAYFPSDHYALQAYFTV
jgi:mRNA deadenylase 3'-5' endonuclease subunit Ccr4